MGCAVIAAALSLSACPQVEPVVTYGAAGAGSAYMGGAADGGTGGESASAGGLGAGHGSGGVGGESAGAGGSSSTGDSSVSFDVTTLPQGGKYQPKNIGAIWVETASGQFVRTLQLWARVRRRYLTKFNSAVGTPGAVDVTASATLPRHEPHHVTWDLTDRSGAAVTPGAYRLWIEVTDAEASGSSYALDFDTRVGSQTLTPADQTYFHALSLTQQ